MIQRLRAWYSEAGAGWLIAAGACLSIALVDGMAFWAFALFAEPLEVELGFSSTDASGVVSATLLLQAISSVVAGRLVDRHGARRILAVGTLGVVVAYVSLAWIRELWQLYTLLFMLAVFQSWVLYVPFTTLVTRWFLHHRTTALSIVMSGFNVGGLLFLPLLTELVGAVGWRTAFIVVGVGLLVFNGLLVLMIRDAPGPGWTERETRAWVDDERRRGPLLDVDSLTDALQTRAFWLLSLGFACFYFSYLAFLYHGPLLLEQEGVPSRYAALIFSSAAGCGLLVRLSCGAWVGRFDRQEVVAAGSVLAMVMALLLLATGGSIPALTGFVLLWGVGSGVCPTLEPILAGRIFGRKQYATVYGAVEGVGIFVAIPGPWLGGLLGEMTGASAPVIFLYSTVLLLAALSFTLLARQLPSWTSKSGVPPVAIAPTVPAPLAGVVMVDVTTAGAALFYRLMTEGRESARNGDRAAAYGRFSHAVRLFPEHEEGWVWKAATTRDRTEALTCLEHVLQLDPTNQIAQRGLEMLRLEQRVGRLEASMHARPPSSASRSL
jgi:OFA family oxalate/formate antiporter-like MFS transporter